MEAESTRCLTAEAEREQRYQLIVGRFSRKLKNKFVFMVFSAWQGFIAHAKRERVILARCAKKIHQRQALSSFLGWVEFCSETKRTKELLERILRRLGYSQLQKGFFPWKIDVENLKEEETACESAQAQKEADEQAREQRYSLVVERFSRKMKNKCIFMVFSAWQAFLLQMKRQSLVLARSSKRLQQRSAVAAFGGWCTFVVERQHVKLLLERIVRRATSAPLARALAAWHHYLDRMDEAAQRDARNEVVLVRFTSRLKSQCSIAAFVTWAAWNIERKRIRSLLERMFRRFTSGVLACGWHAWCRVLDELSEESYKESVLSRFTQKWRNAELHGIFCAWIGYTRESKRITVALRRFGVKLTRHRSLASFNGWVYFVEWRRESRALLKRVLYRLDCAGFGVAFQTWRVTTNELRRSTRNQRVVEVR